MGERDSGIDTVTFEVPGHDPVTITPDDLERVNRALDAAAAERGEQDSVQLPMQQWTADQVALAGVELADRLHRLKVMEVEEAKRKKSWKEAHGEALEDIHALQKNIRAQRAALLVEAVAGVAAEESDS